jgi:hypothetical protein
MTTASITITADTVRPLSLDDYRADLDAMLAALRACGAVAVHDLGATTAPGISDLDLLACLPAEADPGQTFAPVAEIVRRPLRAFLHAPWSIRSHQLPLLPTLCSASRAEDLLGGPPLVQEQTPTQRLVWNVESMIGALGGLHARRRVTTRSSLCLLDAITHNVALAAADGVHAAAAGDFGARVRALRAEWFARSRASREGEIITLWNDADRLLRSLLAGYAAAIGRLVEGTCGDMVLAVPGTAVTCYFTRTRTKSLLLAQPFATVLTLPQELGVLFDLLAEPGIGLDTWISPSHVDEEPRYRVDPAFADAVRGYGRATAEYLDDQLPHPSPFLLLGGATFAHLRSTQGTRIMNLLRRARSRHSPTTTR